MIQFSEGERVWYLDHRPHRTKPQKINQKWIGPFTITKKCNPVLYRIESDHNPPRVYKVHIGRLKKVVRPVEGPQAELPGQPPPDFRDKDEGEEIYLYPPSRPHTSGPYTGPTAGPSSGLPGGTLPRPGHCRTKTSLRTISITNIGQTHQSLVHLAERRSRLLCMKSQVIIARFERAQHRGMRRET
ncbi:MAG: hypothetical protein GY696_23805 [Gammaproteobacteria bacterium]|nr:hypothetical protein [Gammaproteobacteria bacterium]